MPLATAAGDNRWWCGRLVKAAETARAVDEYLMGESLLEAKAVSMITPQFANV